MKLFNKIIKNLKCYYKHNNKWNDDNFLYFLVFDIFHIGLLITLACLCIFLFSSCASMVDFRDKAIAVETTVVGFDFTIPDIFTGMTSSLCTIRFGYVTNRYTSAPKGGKAYSESEYKDFNIWKLTGTVMTKVGTENIEYKVSQDAPVKG
jgi:hypothetical protein